MNEMTQRGESRFHFLFNALHYSSPRAAVACSPAVEH
jgi:hypothetical protein